MTKSINTSRRPPSWQVPATR